MLKEKKQSTFSDVIIFAALLLVGGFHEYISCALTVAMSVYLLLRLCRGKKLTVQKDFLTSAVVALCLGYGLTCLWAIDSGMAFIGFLKFLPVFLYLFCLQQEQKLDGALNVLPYFGAGMAILSAIGMQFAAVKSLFSVAGRLAGFFQYPNTFAVFLLICELLLLKKTQKKIWDYITIAILAAGLLYTGSRTAFLIAIAANVALLFVLSKKRGRLILLAGLGAAVLLAVLLMLGENSVLRRFLTISLTESTFVGRLLYWVDALPLLLKYPFGMGYMGYFYVQQSVQTGIYTVAYAHNDLLQLILDVGLIPSGLFFAAIIKWLVKKTVPVADKIIVGALLLHTFFDFNLQFVSVFFLLILLLSQDKTDKVMVLNPKMFSKISFVVLAMVSLYMGTSLILAHFGARETADAMYPYNTQNKLVMLEQTQDVNYANELADEILAQNTHYYAPYSIKAKYCYSKGNFGTMIQYERQALERNPFQYSEYEAYCKMLIVGIDLYQKAGDTQSADYCKKELVAIQTQLAQTPEKLSALGKLINDQPVTELPAEIQDYINKLGG